MYSVLRSNRNSIFGFATAVVLGLSGCATRDLTKYPQPESPVAIKVGDAKLSQMSEMRIGSYYDEERQIVVSGHQSGVFPGMMLGVVGVFAADAANKSSGEKQFGDETAAGIELDVMLQELIDEALVDPRASNWKPDGDSLTLQLTPIALFTVEKSGDARLDAMIRAELFDANDTLQWRGGYHARSSETYPLNEDGWMAEDRFENAMHETLERLINACIDDTHGRFNELGEVLIKGKFAMGTIEFESRGFLVREDPDSVVIQFPQGNTYVADRSHYKIRKINPETGKPQS